MDGSNVKSTLNVNHKNHMLNVSIQFQFLSLKIEFKFLNLTILAVRSLAVASQPIQSRVTN